jgi:hypothetical protein
LNGNLDLLDEQGRVQAYQQALMNRLNNMTAQEGVSPYTPPLVRGFLPS